jgi:hypothetical protein
MVRFHYGVRYGSTTIWLQDVPARADVHEDYSRYGTGMGALLWVKVQP